MEASDKLAALQNMTPQQIIADNAQEWERSETYHNSFLIGEDEALEANRVNSAAHGLPDIAVSPSQGKLLMLLAQSIGAKNILEVGTLGGCVRFVNTFTLVEN